MNTVTSSYRVIAIDGPAASGKSSVARALARQLGYLYVNTGAMYRAVAFLAVTRGIDPGNATAVNAALASAPLRFTLEGGELTIRLDGIDPMPRLNDQEVNAAVSKVAAIPAVRHLLVARQREFVNEGNLVMEGRDIGSAVFPETPYKFYVDASPEVRAQRRAAQGLTDDLTTRDRIDSSRAASPLVIAPGAEVVDSSYLDIQGVVDEIVTRLKAVNF